MYVEDQGEIGYYLGYQVIVISTPWDDHSNWTTEHFVSLTSTNTLHDGSLHPIRRMHVPFPGPGLQSHTMISYRICHLWLGWLDTVDRCCMVCHKPIWFDRSDKKKRCQRQCRPAM